MIKLHLGCGPHLFAGWDNLDLSPAPGGIRHDLTKPLLYPDSSVSFIFTEHFIEHLDREVAFSFLCECKRVMKNDAVLRLSTPDLAVLVEDYRLGRINRWSSVWNPKNKCQMLNGGMRLWGHKYVFDLEDLESLIREVGFGKISKKAHSESDFDELKNREKRSYMGDLILEVQK